MRVWRFGAALAMALVVATAAMAATDSIRGSAGTRERLALPAGTVLEVELLDVSNADAPALVVGSASIPVVRPAPIPFSLSYDPAVIDPTHAYALAARLVQDGRTLLRSAAVTPVLTNGADASADILLVAADAEAAATPEPAPSIVGTWIAEEIAGAPAADKVVSWLSLTDSGRAQGQGGCNSFSGTYTAEDGTLAFGPLAATRRACPEPAMTQEARFFAALAASKAARIEDGKLVLLDASGAPTARLQPK